MDPGFGKEGSVDLEVAYDGAPTIYKNLLFIGTNFYGPGDRHINPALDQASGQIPEQHAYDVRTGKELWTFHTFPHEGEVGNDTWAKDTWKNRTGNNVWAFALTVDEERGILYIPVSGSGANFYGGDRPGKNLFGNTLVALDANTGKLKWFFQTVHHELWDYNLPPAPGLIDIKKDGKTIPALAQVGKSGYMFILNRVTGKPVYGVEERPVDKSNVPGEASYPTQPFPLKPPAISRTSMTREDIVTAADTTPDHAKACQELWDKFGLHNQGPFTTFPVHTDGDNAKPAIIFPGFTGGANWGGTATDPKLGYIFVNTKDAPAIGWMTKNPKYTPGNSEGSGRIYPHRAAGARQFHRTRARCRWQTDRQLSVLQAAMGPPDRGERRHWRFRVAGSFGRDRFAAGGQTEHGRDRTPRDRSSRRAGWCSSDLPATIASARSIRKPARSCGSPSSTTPRPRSR